MSVHVPPEGDKYEHAIVRLLLARLAEGGWAPFDVDDDELYNTVTPDDVLDMIFDVMDPRVRFHKPNTDYKGTQWVKLVHGNGDSMISDWSFNEGDEDGFNAIVQGVSDFLDTCAVQLIDPKAEA